MAHLDEDVDHAATEAATGWTFLACGSHRITNTRGVSPTHFEKGSPMNKHPLLRHETDVTPIDCPYGTVRRIVTGGEGGVANVHLVEVTEGGAHYHNAYDEVYYVLDGEGTLSAGDVTGTLCPGTVATIPAGCVHALKAAEGQRLRFLIVGTPPCPIDHPDAKPRRA